MQHTNLQTIKPNRNMHWNHYTAWTQSDVNTLKAMAHQGSSVYEIAEALQRTEAAIRFAAHTHSIAIKGRYQSQRDAFEHIVVDLANRCVKAVDIKDQIFGECGIDVSLSTIYNIIAENGIDNYKTMRAKRASEISLKYNRLIGAALLTRLMNATYVAADAPGAVTWVPKELLVIYMNRNVDHKELAAYMKRTPEAIHTARHRYFKDCHKVSESVVKGWLANNTLKKYSTIKNMDSKLLGAIIAFCYKYNIEIPEMDHGQPLYQIDVNSMFDNLQADLDESNIGYDLDKFKSIKSDIVSRLAVIKSYAKKGECVNVNATEIVSEDKLIKAAITVSNIDAVCYIEQALTGTETISSILLNDMQSIVFKDGSFKLITTVKPGEKHTL